MQQNKLFSILDKVESTNNYATGLLHEGMATHGQAWFAKEQFGGKGQRGKTWKSNPGENIILSIALRPYSDFRQKPFLFSALIANECRIFFQEHAKDAIKIKWPNDIYWHDGKAGGILIENIYKNSEWQWAVAGIGININQTSFASSITNAVSLKNITGKNYDSVALAGELHEKILLAHDKLTATALAGIMKLYNGHLYKKGGAVLLKKDQAVFASSIKMVNDFGQLITEDVIERNFNVGDVQFVLK